jgi:GABA(A) receptor-associated protein
MTQNNSDICDNNTNALRIIAKYPDRLPLVVNKHEKSELPEIAKKKFLVPRNMLCAEFKYIINKYLQKENMNSNLSDKSIYLYICDSRYSIKPSEVIHEIYDKYKSTDSFLYLMYSSENTLGI